MGKAGNLLGTNLCDPIKSWAIGLIESVQALFLNCLVERLLVRSNLLRACRLGWRATILLTTLLWRATLLRITLLLSLWGIAWAALRRIAALGNKY